MKTSDKDKYDIGQENYIKEQSKCFRVKLLMETWHNMHKFSCDKQNSPKMKSDSRKGKITNK